MHSHTIIMYITTLSGMLKLIVTSISQQLISTVVQSVLLLMKLLFSPPHSIYSHPHSHEELENAAGPEGNVAMHSHNEPHHAGLSSSKL